MGFISIALFFIYTMGLGYSLTSFVKNSENIFERVLMWIGIGFGTLITLGFLLNLLHMPLDWKIFLFLSLLIPIISLRKIRNVQQLKFSITKYDLSIFVMLLLFLITFYMYYKGAYTYPYLEDDDSWSHAIGLKYVSIEKKIFAGANNHLHYIDPYPPVYDMFFGIMHQTNNSVYWTLKFFNALIISLCIVFFYFFVKVFTGSYKKALFAAFVLFSIPAFLSHFIWSIAITMPLFFISFYAVEKIKDDKKWWVVASIVMVGTLTSSPTHSTYFALFYIIYFSGRVLSEKKFLMYESLSGFLAVALSFIFWWVPMLYVHGLEGTLSGIGIQPTSRITGIEGTADRIYTLNDFIFAKEQNMINNPIGIGFFVSVLTFAGLIFLVIKNYSFVRKKIVFVIIFFLFINGLLVFFLTSSYIKFVPKKDVQALEKGSTSFLEFISERFFLISVLSLMVFVLVILFAIRFFEKDFNYNYLIISILWLIFSFYAVNAAPFSYKLSPFRAWMILAIPISLIAAEFLFLINGFAKSVVKSLIKSDALSVIFSIIIVGIIGYGIITTSFVQKYKVNTAIWGPGGFWTSNEEIQGYLWMKENIGYDIKVFSFYNNAPIIGFDKFTCHWCEEVRVYQEKGFNESIEQNYQWLKKLGYKNIVIDGQTAREFGVNETAEKIIGLANSGKFRPVFNNNAIVIFEIV